MLATGFHLPALIVLLIFLGQTFTGGAVALLGLLSGRPGIAFAGCAVAMLPWFFFRRIAI